MNQYAAYGIAGLGVAGMMTAGWHSGELIALIGQYITPAVAGIGVAGLMVAGMYSPSANYRLLTKGTLTISETHNDVATAAFGIRCTCDDRPREGDPVVMAIGTLEDPLFAGYIEHVEEGKACADKYDYHCQARALARDLEKRILSAYDLSRFGLPVVWTNAYAGTILKALLAAYTPHFYDNGHLEQGVFLGEMPLLGKTLLEVCSELATRSHVVFYIAANRDIVFQRRTVQTAAWQLEYSEHFGGLNIKERSTQIKNRIAVYYSELEARAETFAGNGERRVFLLERAPYDVEQLTVNGAAVTYGTRYAENNSTNDFSVNYNEGEVHTQAHDTLGEDDVLAIEYMAAIPAMLVVNHADSQFDHRDRDGGDGIYDFAIHAEQDICRLEDAQARAEAELEQYAYPQVTASYDRRDCLFDFQTTRLRVGQQQCIQVRGRHVALMIERVTIKVAIPQQGHLLKFVQHVELGPVSRGLERIFRDMQVSQDGVIPEIITTREV